MTFMIFPLTICPPLSVHLWGWASKPRATYPARFCASCNIPAGSGSCNLRPCCAARPSARGVPLGSGPACRASRPRRRPPAGSTLGHAGVLLCSPSSRRSFPRRSSRSPPPEAPRAAGRGSLVLPRDPRVPDFHASIVSVAIRKRKV
jgi:hypothetical protein